MHVHECVCVRMCRDVVVGGNFTKNEPIFPQPLWFVKECYKTLLVVGCTYDSEYQRDKE